MCACVCVNTKSQLGGLHCADFAVDGPGVDGDKRSRLDADRILGQNCAKHIITVSDTKSTLV